MRKTLQSAIAIITLCLSATLLHAQTTILTQNFSGGSIPSGWSTSNLYTAPGWHVSTSSNLSTELFPIPAYSGKIAATDDYRYGDTTANVNNIEKLNTPAMNFSGHGHVVLYFDAFFLGQYAIYPDYYSTATVMISTDGGQTWSLLQQISASPIWQHYAIDLSVSYGNQSSVKLSFQYYDGGVSILNPPYTGNPYGLAIGNVLVVSPPDYEIALNTLTIPALAIVNNAGTGTAPINVTLQNKGGYPITSATINWTVNNGDVQTETLSKLNIPTAASSSYTLSSTIPVTDPTVAYNVTAWITSPDGESINGDDTISASVYGLSGQVKRTVLIEEATGEWCGFCPDGAYDLDTINAAHPDIIGVSIHDDGGGEPSEDTLQIPDGETIVDNYISSFPGGLIDRQYYAFDYAVEQQRFGWDSLAVAQLSVLEPVTVGLYNTYDSATRTIKATVLAKMYSSLPGNYTVNIYVCEDSVRSWQHNYYSNAYDAGAFPTSPFYDSVFDMLHFPENRVVRAILGGPFGTGNVISSTPVPNMEYDTIYSYAVPAGYNTKHMFLVATVEQLDSSNVNNSPILNSVKCPLNSFAQNSVTSTYFTSDTGSVNSGDSTVFYRGDSLYYQGGYIVFQLGDTVTINGVTIIITATNDSVVLHPGDVVTVNGPTGAGSTTFPQGSYTHYSFGTISFLSTTGIAAVNGKESLNVYPNPADRQLNLSLDILQNSEVQVILSNVAGQKVKDMENLSMSAGSNTLSLSTADLAPGVYILTVRTALSSLSNKVVITR